MSGYTVEVRTGILTNDNTIHSWIHITKPDGAIEAYGFYPATDSLGNMISGPGVVKSEKTNNEYSASSGPLNISSEQYTELKNYIESPPPDYSLPYGSQYTHWTLRALNKAGLIPSILTPNMISDNNVRDILETIAWNPATQAVGFKINDLINRLLDISNNIYPAMPPGSIDCRRCHPPIDPTKPNSFTNSKSWRPAPSDPFILDLDGDGVETINLTSGILFDHNADGVKTGTGWVKGDDALLVRDLNGNGTIDSGRELFGDQTLLANGQIAANGFSALRDLDSNADGVIDASDAAFGELKVWRDLNQDGISQADELQTLGEAGISSIGLTSTTSTTRHNGNAITSLGSYTKADGSTGTTADVNLAINTATTEFSDEVEVPEALLDLPDMAGSGQVRDLLQAATLSPTLTDLLTQYTATTTRDAQLALMDQMLLAWADTSAMAKSLDERAKADYRIEYLGFGTGTIRGQATY